MGNRHNSAVFRLPYPSFSDAAIASAVMGYGVICYHNGLYHLVWWEGEERFSQVLMWDECSDCGDVGPAILDVCPDCMMEEQQEEKVA